MDLFLVYSRQERNKQTTVYRVRVDVGEMCARRAIHIANLNTNPGNADRNAAGLNAGNSVGPHNDMNGMCDHVRNGADGGMMLPKCDTGDRRPVVGGDGEHRRFLMSATIVTFSPQIHYKISLH